MTNPSSQLPVAVDAMGADLGPRVVVEGVLGAVRRLNIPAVIVGKEEEIRSILDGFGAAGEQRVTIEHAPEEITMHDTAGAAIRGKPRSSIRVAFELVRDRKACAVVSPGNTGAMMAAGVFVVGTLPGIARPAIATLIPKVGCPSPMVLVDSGANVDCHADQLVQFALMGECYASSVLNLPKARVALISNGSEPSKGTDVTRAAAAMLGELPELNFIGYVEGRDLGRDVVDVVVCDGFVGNVILKTMEGTVELVFDSIREYVEKSVRGKIGMWLAKPIFKALFRERLDPSAYGGAPLLGLNEIGIVCHGSSSARAIENGVRVAKKFVDEGLVHKVQRALTGVDVQHSSGIYEDGIWDRMGERFDKRRKRKKAGAAAAGEQRSDQEPE